MKTRGHRAHALHNKYPPLTAARLLAGSIYSYGALGENNPTVNLHTLLWSLLGLSVAVEIANLYTSSQREGPRKGNTLFTLVDLFYRVCGLIRPAYV